MHKQTTLILFFLVITCFISRAQVNEVLKFQFYTTNDGLPDNYCETILQDSYGFMWIGTADGLCRFDGYNFKTFKNNQTDTNSISSNFILTLFEDSKMQLWIGTNLGGISVYNPITNNFKQYIFQVEDSLNNHRNIIHKFVEINNCIWIASMNGLGKFNMQTNKITWFLTPKTEYYKFDNDQIMCVLPSGNKLWVGTDNTGLYLFNTKTEKFEKHFYHIQNNDSTIVSNKISDLYLHTDGKIWIGTQDAGICLFDPEKEVSTMVFNHNENLASIGSDYISDFCNFNNNLWVGTINGGLNLFNESSNDFRHFSDFSNQAGDIKSLSILNITPDNFGNLWIATHGRGIVFISPIHNQFKHINISNATNGNPIANYVSCFYEDKQGKIWIGTDGGGLFLYNKKNSSFQSFNKNDGFTSEAILRIIEANNDQLWISTWGGGVNLFDKNQQRVVKTYTHNESMNSIGINDIKDILLDSGKLYIPTHGDGLNILDLQTHKVISWRNNTEYNFSLNIPELGNQIIKDKENRFWIATLYGLYVIDGKNLKTYINNPGDTNSLNGFITSCLFKDSKSRIWVGTERGLSLYNEKTDSFVNFDQDDGIPTKIKSVEEDNGGNLWISSNQGITKFNPFTKEVSRYNLNDGLQGNQFIERSSIKLSSGELLFGGLNGFNIFNPDEIVDHYYKPKVFLVDFEIFNKSQISKEYGSVLDKNITLTDEIKVKYNQSVISFEYAALAYGFQHNIEYLVFLEGFDSDWRNMGAERKATYTNLDPGTYNFKVKAFVDREIESEVSLVKLIVLPPWYKTVLFRVLAIVLFVLLLWLFFNNRLQQINRVNKLLEKEVAFQTDKLVNANTDLKEYQREIIIKNKELEDQNKELDALNKTKDRMFSIIAHDIKNPINSIMGFSELLLIKHKKITEERTEEFISYIYNSSSRLAELLSNLLVWARSQTGAINFNPRSFNVKELIQKNIDLVNTMIFNKELNVELECDADIEIMLDANMINTVMRNLLTNAIKFTPRMGLIQIKVVESDTHCNIAVSDTGFGLSKDGIHNLLSETPVDSKEGTENEKGSGLGLVICKDFLIRHNSKLAIESELEKGSTFSFSLPKIYGTDD